MQCLKIKFCQEKRNKAKIGNFGDNYRHQHHDTISAGDKGKKPDISLSRNIDFTIDNPEKISIFNWKIES